MLSNRLRSRSAGRLAVATGGAGVIGFIALILFFIFGGPLGTLNDLCNALVGVLSAGLAWRLYPQRRAGATRLDRLAQGTAWLGALVVIAGSALVISRRTGWYLAGLYSTFGFGLIGLWVWRLHAAPSPELSWPRRFDRFGRITGIVMAAGLLTLPGILRGVDGWATAPWWANASMAAGVGWFLLYPVWCLSVGRILSREHAERPKPALGLAAGQD
jgi:hypothetical protein